MRVVQPSAKKPSVRRQRPKILRPGPSKKRTKIQPFASPIRPSVQPRKEIVKFLWLYIATPQCTTGKAPSVLLNNRKIRTKILSMIVKPEGREHDEAREREKEEKRKQKQRADVRRKAKEKTIKEGDRILLRRKKTTTKSPWDPDPFVVESVKGGQVTGQRDGERMTRNVLKWKILKEARESEEEEERGQRGRNG